MHTHTQYLLDALHIENDGIPIYVQIREQFLREIAAGIVPAGGQLPTMRQVAVTLKIDLNTVRHAYDELERAGAITLARGRGSFVAESPKIEAPVQPDLILQAARQFMASAISDGLDPVSVAQAILRLARMAKTP